MIELLKCIGCKHNKTCPKRDKMKRTDCIISLTCCIILIVVVIGIILMV